MTTLRQAAEQLLEAFDDYPQEMWNIGEKLEALRKALAEPECKTHPDAPHGFCRNSSASEDRYVCECEYWNPPQKQWVGLTDEDMSKIFDKFDWKEIEIAGEYLDLPTFAKVIEAKLKEKNT